MVESAKHSRNMQGDDATQDSENSQQSTRQADGRSRVGKHGAEDDADGFAAIQTAKRAQQRNRKLADCWVQAGDVRSEQGENHAGEQLQGKFEQGVLQQKAFRSV